jgi:hypothetical protein
MAVRTQYGSVDADILDKLKVSYDTKCLLAAVDALDRMKSTITDVREKLLCLHGMADAVINDGLLSGVSNDDAIYEVAERISVTLDGWPAELVQIINSVDELAGLTPDGEDEI